MFDVFYTKGKDDAKNRAAELKPGDYDFIVSVGGDGTLNEVTNGLILSEVIFLWQSFLLEQSMILLHI